LNGSLECLEVKPLVVILGTQDMDAVILGYILGCAFGFGNS
jgi:hypothetical protein